MAEILERAHGQQKLTLCSVLILQPQSEPDRVRRMLHRIGFAIQAERMVEDRGKRYVILKSEPGREHYEPEEYLYGRRLWQARDTVFQKVLLEDLSKLDGLIENLQTKPVSSRNAERIREFEIQRQWAERMLEQWDIQ